jgi:hypothetical protein
MIVFARVPFTFHLIATSQSCPKLLVTQILDRPAGVNLKFKIVSVASARVEKNLCQIGVGKKWAIMPCQGRIRFRIFARKSKTNTNEKLRK